MKKLKVKDLVIGEGIPKICVPVMGKNQEEILQAMKQAAKSSADLVEWRADFWEQCEDTEVLDDLLEKIQNILKHKPLLFTIRTSNEGGAYQKDAKAYANVLSRAAKKADLVDVEVFMPKLDAKNLIRQIQDAGSKVVASNHDFHATPAKEEIVSRLANMEQLGADVAKIAVMPQSDKDVLTLLDATQERKNQSEGIPTITMSMAGKGVISRISGETFGSAVTFASLTKASAPGQIDLEDLRHILQILHENKEK